MPKTSSQKCLLLTPNKRISARAALDHPWFGLVNEIKIQSVVDEEEKLDGKLIHRLKSYKKVHTLRKAILNVLVKMLKPKETHYIAEVFKRLDKDQTGLVSIQELTNSLNKSDPTLNFEDAKGIISELDFADNKKINYSEFLSA